MTAHCAVVVEDRVRFCEPTTAPMIGVMSWKGAVTVTLAESPKVEVGPQTVAVTFAGTTVTNPPDPSFVAAHMTVLEALQFCPLVNVPVIEAATSAASLLALVIVICA